MKSRRPPPPVEAPWAPWKSTESDTESTALRLSVQVVKAAVQIFPGGSIHAGKTAYTDMLHFGFWLGVDPADQKPKVNIGGPDWYIKFTGTAWDISIYSGLTDGGHIGMRYSDTDDVDRWTLEAVDSANVPFFSAETGLTDLETALTIGYADHAKIALVGQEIVVDPECIAGLVTDHGSLSGLADNDHPQYSLSEHTHEGLSAAPLFPLLLADPASPAAGEGWILKTPIIEGGAASGLLLALTATAIVGYTRQLTVYDGAPYRVELAADS